MDSKNDDSEVKREEHEEEQKLFSLGPEMDREMGEEFTPDVAQPLFLSEVAFLLQKSVSQHGEVVNSEVNPVLKKAHEYAQRFDPFKSGDTAMAVRDQLADVKPGLHPFEIAQLASLVPDSSEEAKLIIPSLADKYDDMQMQEILNGLNTLRQ